MNKQRERERKERERESNFNAKFWKLSFSLRILGKCYFLLLVTEYVGSNLMIFIFPAFARRVNTINKAGSA